MPFPMVHLLIAKNIISVTPEISNPSAFLLGSIAPDSVHFRPGYHSDMKIPSHLCVGDGQWGRFINNAEWVENVLRFLDRNRHSPDIDFVLGYCAHILADIKNNIEIWTPFRLTHQAELDSGLGSRLHKEAVEVDLELYRTCRDRREICNLLEHSEGIDMPGMVERSDIERAKSHLLYKQYVNREVPDMSSYEFVTVKRMIGFVTEASEEIRDSLLPDR